MVIVTPVDFRAGALIGASRWLEVLFLLPLIKVKGHGATRLTGVFTRRRSLNFELKSYFARS